MTCMKHDEKITLEIIAGIMILVGIFIFMDQVIRYSVLFSPDQFFHHETFFVIFPVIGMTILITIYALGKKKKGN